MYVSIAVALAVLAGTATIAARRDRSFLIVASLAFLTLALGLPRGTDGPRPPSLPLAALVVSAIVSAGEAFGLPRWLARSTRLGIRHPERDFDERLMRLLGPFAARLGDERIVLPGGRRDRMRLAARRLDERLAGLAPPTPAWAQVRDGYVRAVGAIGSAVSRMDREPSPRDAWESAIREPLEHQAVLRAAYRPGAPPAPQWALVVLFLTLVTGAFAPLQLVDRADEVIAAPSVAAGWSHMTMPFARGDSWDGDAVSDGRRIYLASREDVRGFWGTIRLRSSADGGATWSSLDADTLAVASPAARPAMAVGPDGSLWMAFATQGYAPATQALRVARSVDGGASWQVDMDAAPREVGIVGLPALVVTPEVRLVAYTDAATGDAIVQRFDPAGYPRGLPAELGRTSRELYSDAQFLDAGFALAAEGRHVVALWHSSVQRLEVSISDDAGVTWRAASPLSTGAAWPRASLLVVGGRFVALVARAGYGSQWLELDASGDGGATWQVGSRVSSSPFVGGGVVARTGDTWSLAYAACIGVFGCASDPRVWYRSSPDGQRWSDPQALTPPGTYTVVGTGAIAGRPWAIWERDLTVVDTDRVVEGVRR